MNPALTRTLVRSLQKRKLASVGIIVPSIYSNKVYQGDVFESVKNAFDSMTKTVAQKPSPAIDVKTLIQPRW